MAVKTGTVRRALTLALPILVVAYAAALRFEALTLNYGPVDSPQWLRAVQVHSAGMLRVLHPARMSWSPVELHPHRDGPPTKYFSDPYTYLQHARSMHSFYEASLREPVFPFVTKVWLRLLNDQDVAVSFASAAFSILAVLATYLLGSLAFSRWVGLGAALAMAMEFDVISLGVGGCRDDAFMCAVVFFLYALLRHARTPSRGTAIFLGIVAGLACLIRITSLSFVAPGLLCLLLLRSGSWKTRLQGVGLSAGIMAAIVSPFLITCWITFGDPLYAIDVHANVYQVTEGRAAEPGLTALSYIKAEASRRPIRLLETVALGLTRYPFLNKWTGFDVWSHALGVALSWASILGLVLFLGSAAGRVTLVILVTSLVPFSVTWRLLADWRFTEHAYPLLLIASCFAIGQTAAGIARLRGRDGVPRTRPRLRACLLWSLVVTVIGVSTAIVMWVLPLLVMNESLRVNEDVSIMAGSGDTLFFAEGWSVPVDDGITVRLSQGPSSALRFPLPRQQNYDLTLRLDPFPRPTGRDASGLPTVSAFVNGVLISSWRLTWDPERMGSYTIHVPAALVRIGINHLAIVATDDAGQVATAAPGTQEHPRFRLWYLRVLPQG